MKYTEGESREGGVRGSIAARYSRETSRTMASSSKKLCRFCLSLTSPNHATSIFSSASNRVDLSTTLSSIFRVTVAPDERLSSYACRKCVDTALSLHSKLQSLQLMARENYHKRLSSVETQVRQAGGAPSGSIAPQKRTKDTSSGPGISPTTMKSQPPRKRWLQMGKKLFPVVREKKYSKTNTHYCSK